MHNVVVIYGLLTLSNFFIFESIFQLLLFRLQILNPTLAVGQSGKEERSLRQLQDSNTELETSICSINIVVQILKQLKKLYYSCNLFSYDCLFIPFLVLNLPVIRELLKISEPKAQTTFKAEKTFFS